MGTGSPGISDSENTRAAQKISGYHSPVIAQSLQLESNSQETETRNIVSPTKNGHTPPSTESGKKEAQHAITRLTISSRFTGFEKTLEFLIVPQISVLVPNEPINSNLLSISSNSKSNLADPPSTLSNTNVNRDRITAVYLQHWSDQYFNISSERSHSPKIRIRLDNRKQHQQHFSNSTLPLYNPRRKPYKILEA
ncbi:hypothetical protein K0M31_007125 [Melipona bicolor]|uniref:Uncharacterized protein n=1 Tax=Melipona bicolor TaxID=60889 RepID=A0AA40FSC3_9HYME|nr:hypothetical protein K0M31_007125 [Melipona bicolor]